MISMDELQVFIDKTMNFFNTMLSSPAELGLAYVLDGEPEYKEYTAVIGLTGNRAGVVCVLASDQFMEKLSKDFLKVDEITVVDKRDMLGEFANVISGNIMESLGGGFNISPPAIFEGKPTYIEVKCKSGCFAIPLEWNQSQALIICGIS